MKLSVVIPAYNEEDSIVQTIELLEEALEKASILHETIVINDNSSDNTLKVLNKLKDRFPFFEYYTNPGPNGFGYAVRYGLNRFKGDCVAVMMADLSDDPQDLISFYHAMIDGNFDCVFGSRWIKGGRTVDYPRVKKIVNRIANKIVQLVMGIRYNDATNAFKLYKRGTIEGVRPFLSPHFNLTIELPLKAIIRGYSYKILPNSWTNRKFGESKLKIREMGSRYFFILMYCFIEKYFSKGDFKKRW